MFDYIIMIGLESGISYVRDGGTDILYPDIRLATRYVGYYEASKQLAKILANKVFNDPVQISIVPSPESWGRYRETWTVEDILRNAG